MRRKKKEKEKGQMSHLDRLFLNLKDRRRKESRKKIISYLREKKCSKR